MDRERYQIIFLPEAKEDLANIAEYIARDNPERAYSYTMELAETAKSLECEPLKGHEYKRGEQKGLRVINHGNYQIIYKVTEAEKVVEIWTFWHGARKPPKF